MSGGEDEADKEHEASQQKLDQARKEGDLPRSADLQTATATGGLLLALISLGAWAVERAGTAGMVALDPADRLSTLVATGGRGAIAGLVLSFAGPPMALLLVAPILVLGLLFTTRGIVFAPTKLAPKLSRISPVATAGQKFGVEGLVEFGKSAVKMGVVGLILYQFLAARLEDILASLYLTPAMSAALMARMVLEFLFIVFLIQLALGGVDYLWQVFRHRQRHRMSRKEMMDEYKESEGDPHLKAARRQRAQEVATNRMLSDVATANVVVVNPTHYAVALKWDRAKGGAPICVAKGVDALAMRIREVGREHNVPIVENVPLARALYAAVDIDETIPREHLEAAAKVIGFVLQKRKKR